ncbi:hypothetical protein, partial [[Pseudomonas] boreopolis]|uniref:hypothetical protein n=1 Tax=Xanthomonas boreopolis TaxID=86183 RepID=UPI003D9B4971
LHGRDQRFDALPQRGGNLFATCHAGDFVITAQVYKAVLLAALNREVRLKDVDTQRLSKQAVVQQSQRRSLHNTL